MEESPKDDKLDDKLIHLAVEQLDQIKPDYTTDVNVAAKDTKPVAEFPLSEGIVKSEASLEDVSTTLDESAK